MSDAFFKALKTIKQQEPVEPEYRLYYDPDSGHPLFYTMEREPGTYIRVDKKTYDASNYHCTVEKNKIVNWNTTGKYKKLVPAQNGTTTHPHNVMLVSDIGQAWKIKIYED